jgi:hypothetical protein
LISARTDRHKHRHGWQALPPLQTTAALEGDIMWNLSKRVLRHDFGSMLSKMKKTAKHWSCEQPGWRPRGQLRLRPSDRRLRLTALTAQVRIHVKDVARSGHMKDSFPLQEADQGDLHMTLSWTPVERDE